MEEELIERPASVLDNGLPSWGKRQRYDTIRGSEGCRSVHTVSYALPDLLKRLRGDQYAIPQFQRDFTWRETQVKLLIDSLARNYPIGPLLVLPRSPEMRLKTRTIDAALKELDHAVAPAPAESEAEAESRESCVGRSPRRARAVACRWAKRGGGSGPSSPPRSGEPRRS